MSKYCFITNRTTIIGNKRSHAMNKTKRKFLVNMHKKKFWLINKNKYIRLFVSTKAIKFINKYGIENVLNYLNFKY